MSKVELEIGAPTINDNEAEPTERASLLRSDQIPTPGDAVRKIQHSPEYSLNAYRFVTALHVLSPVSVLVEDLCALYLISDAFDSQIIFWVFYSYGLISAVADCCLSINKNCENAFVSAGVNIALQLAQALLFVSVSEWSPMTIAVFGSIFCLQVAMEIVEKCLVAEFPNRNGILEDDVQVKRREKNERQKSRSIAKANCFNSVVLGVSLMPFLYYDESSVFRSHWYDIYMTCCFWITAATVTFHVNANPILSDDDEFCGSVALTKFRNRFAGALIPAFFMFNSVLQMALCIAYLPDANPGFEYVHMMLMIISGSIVACCFCSVGCCIAIVFCNDPEEFKSNFNAAMEKAAQKEGAMYDAEL